MPDISAIAGAMSALKATKDILEAMISLRDAAVFQQKRFELQSLIIDAQSSVFAANEERAALIETRLIGFAHAATRMVRSLYSRRLGRQHKLAQITG